MGGEPPVPVGVFGDLFEGLTGVFRDEFRHFPFGLGELFGLDGNVGCGTAHACGGLVHHDAGVRQGVAFAFGAAGEEELAHGGRQAHGVGGNVTGRIGHGVVNGHACGDGAAGGINVERNVAGGVFGGQEEDLGAQFIGDFVVDLGSEEDNAIAEQSFVNGVAEVETGCGHGLILLTVLCGFLGVHHTMASREKPYCSLSASWRRGCVEKAQRYGGRWA